MLAGSERALKGDRVSPMQCHRQLLEQVDGLFGVASDGRCSPSDFPYQFHHHHHHHIRLLNGLSKRNLYNGLR